MTQKLQTMTKQTHGSSDQILHKKQEDKNYFFLLKCESHSIYCLLLFTA